jgi:hypothetical protein
VRRASLYLLALLPLRPLPAAAQAPDLAPAVRAEAIAAIDGIEDPRQRAVTRLAVADRLMRGGSCREALPLLGPQMLDGAEIAALLPVFPAAAGTRDPACMTRIADALRQAARRPADAASRAWATRLAAALSLLAEVRGGEEPADPAGLAALDHISDRERIRRFHIGTLTLVVGYADAPTERQQLLLEILAAFRGTSHFDPLLRTLAAQARENTHYLNAAGWAEIAVLLARAGDEGAARSLVASVGSRLMSPAGLRVALAIEGGRFDEAAAGLVAHGWSLRDEQQRRLITAAPLALLPHAASPAYWDGDPLAAASYAEALDAGGHRAESEAMAAAAPAMFTGNFAHPSFCNRRARLLARLGRLSEAQACVVAAERVEPGSAALVAARMIRGLAWRGDAAAIDAVLMPLSAARRGAALRWLWSDNLWPEGCGFDPAIQVHLADMWAGLRRPPDAGMIRGAAGAGCDSRALARLIGDGPAASGLRFAAAQAAQRGGRAALAAALVRPLRQRPLAADSWLAGMARIHWAARQPQRALLFARGIRSQPLRARVLIEGWLAMQAPNPAPHAAYSAASAASCSRSLCWRVHISA